MRTPALERAVFLLLLTVVTVAFASLLLPFFGAVLWAVALAMLFHPVFQFIARRMPQRRSVAALLTVLIVLVAVILPTTAIGLVLVEDLVDLVARIRSGEINVARAFERAWNAAPAWVTTVLRRFGLGDLAAIQERIQGVAGVVAQEIASRAVSVGQQAFGLLVSFGIMLYLMFFMVRDGAVLSKGVREATPLARSQSHYLLNKFTTVMRATIKGNVVVAAIQGALGGVAFAVLGVQGALLWGVLMALLSLLPVVGGALVWLPVALYLLAIGSIWKAVMLAAFCAVVVGSVDNVLRPILIGKETQMPDYVVLLSTLGGIALFGVNGFVIGPVIAALFLTAWRLFAEPTAPGHESPASVPAAQSSATDSVMSGA